MVRRSNGHDHVSSPAGRYSPLLGGDEFAAVTSRHSHRNICLLSLSVASVFLLIVGAILGGVDSPSTLRNLVQPEMVPTADILPRGVREGVSSKSSPALSSGLDSFRWSNEMLQWQRTAFHFQPEKNWMNDPNGPLYYKGWYHLFYQYNPDAAVWGKISWGHAVSRDLVGWLHLPIAMKPDQWYDANGVWTGSATILPDGRIAMLYTGSTNASVQVQNLAFPADPADPLLLHWSKHPSNPVLLPPRRVSPTDFRDPTTAWYVPSRSAWQLAIGSKGAGYSGIVLVYETRDFLSYELLPGVLHAVRGTGMWECVDFYPVSLEGSNGLDTSVIGGGGLKHVLKASMDDERNDYYAIGTYDVDTGRWTPDRPELDVGIGLRYDYGAFYASKTFFDKETSRRVLWGWVGERDSEVADVSKGWASLQGIPRTVRLDEKTRSNLIQWPVEEVEKLRSEGKRLTSVELLAGSLVPLPVRNAAQLDILVDFEVSREATEGALEAEEGFLSCSTNGGASRRGALGPFGLLVLANENLSEQTAVYFYVAKDKNGALCTFVCQDELRSTRENGVVVGVYGSTVPVLDGEKLSLRVLVDHSIVETFAQGGRTCITSRVYPMEAIDGTTKLFLFNNATTASVMATSVEVWEMDSASIRSFPGLENV